MKGRSLYATGLPEIAFTTEGLLIFHDLALFASATRTASFSVLSTVSTGLKQLR